MDRERLSHLSRLESSKTAYKVQAEETQITKPIFTTALKNITNATENSTIHLECRLEPLNDPNLRNVTMVSPKYCSTVLTLQKMLTADCCTSLNRIAS